MTRAEAIKAIAEASVAATRGKDCPAELVAAQAILESGWLQAAPGNNCFGIKAVKGAANRQLLRTTEWFTEEEVAKWLAADGGRTAELAIPVQADQRGRHRYTCKDWFATFPTLADCFARRVELFGKGQYAPYARDYATSRDFPTMVRNISRIYATDPNYADKVLGIVRRPDVLQALEEARKSV